MSGKNKPTPTKTHLHGDNFFRQTYMPFSTALGKALRKARERKGMTVKELAKATYNLEALVSGIEDGTKRFSMNFFWFVWAAYVLDTTPGALMAEAEEAVRKELGIK